MVCIFVILLTGWCRMRMRPARLVSYASLYTPHFMPFFKKLIYFNCILVNHISNVFKVTPTTSEIRSQTVIFSVIFSVEKKTDY